MLKQVTKTIGEHEYVIRQLNAVQGRAVFLRFAKLVAPALKELGISEGNEKAIEKGNLLAAIAAVASGASEEDQTYFCDVFAQNTDLVVINDKGARCTPKLSTVYLLHFAGDMLPEMYEWLVACFEVNFGSFFARLGVTRGTTAAPTTESK